MSVAFQYTAIRPGGKDKIHGTIKANSEREARELLREKELLPINIKAIQNADNAVAKLFAKRAPSKAQLWLAEKLATFGLKEKLSFTQNMALMLRAGIPITEVLMYMERYAENPKFRYMLIELRQSILNGTSLSSSLSKFGNSFDEVYIGIIRAGESSGELETVLDRLHALLITAQKLRKQIISAMIYPCILMFIMTIALLAMFLFIIPTFTGIYKQMGVQLPWVTLMMIAISDFLKNFWILLILGIAGGVYGFYRYVNTSAGRQRVDALLMRIPVVKGLIQYVSLCNFIATLHVSFSSGLPITDCMYLASKTVTHTQIREVLEDVNYQIQTGQRLGASLYQTGLMPDMVMIMLSSGEESGELEKMLKQSLEFLEEEVTARVEVLMSLMEPALLLVLGSVVLLLALSVYLPLFSMYEHI